MGFQDEDIPDFIAFCFCCPCCCHEIKFENLAKGELKHILHQSSGYQVRCIEDKCIRCGKCVEACPQKALHVVRTGEVKEKLYDYFEKAGAEW